MISDFVIGRFLYKVVRYR